MTDRTKAFIETHIAVFLFGFTAILGVWIDMPALSMVAWRVLIAAVIYALMIGWKKWRSEGGPFPWSPFVNGFIIALHWLCFYGAIKLSNASVALVCLATTSFFTALVEPWITGRRHRRIDVLLAIVMVPAMYLVVQGIDESLWAGVWVGLLAAIGAAVFSSWNKLLVGRWSGIRLSFVEMCGATVVLVVAVLVYGGVVPDFKWMPQGWDWFWLGILTLVCTNLAFVMSIRVLRFLSAFESNLIFNLEPVYGILLAFVLLGERSEVGPAFYVGTALIMTVVFGRRWIIRYFDGGVSGDRSPLR